MKNMRNLITITDKEKEDILIQALRTQEMDLYTHSLDKERYQDMAKDLPEDNELRKKLEKEILVIDSRLAGINSAITAINKQIPAGTDLAVALTRIKAKEGKTN